MNYKLIIIVLDFVGFCTLSLAYNKRENLQTVNKSYIPRIIICFQTSVMPHLANRGIAWQIFRGGFLRTKSVSKSYMVDVEALRIYFCLSTNAK